MTTALIVSVIDIGAFGELALLRTLAPWVFERFAGLWLSLAVLSMFGGALLALAQRDLKRMLAFSTIDDLGYLLLGRRRARDGTDGRLVGRHEPRFVQGAALWRLGIAEARLGRPVTLDDRKLSARFRSAEPRLWRSLGLSACRRFSVSPAAGGSTWRACSWAVGRCYW